MANPALIDELEKQFRDNPRRVFARLANEYRKAGDFMRAIEICHAHVPQQPGYISGHIVLGQALYDAGELDQAEQTFQAALALDPENLIALRQLGDIARNRRDYREARGWYTRLLEVDPQNEEIVAQLGELALSDDGVASRNGASSHAAIAEPTPERTDWSDDTHEAAELEEAPVEAASDAGVAAIDEAPIDAMEVPEADVEVAHHGEMAHHNDAPRFGDEAADEAPEEAASSVHVEPDGVARPDEAPRPDIDADEDEVAWMSVEEAPAGDEALIVEEIVEMEAAETVIATDPREMEQAMDADLDFTFEAEEFDAPLRPHTGESLSVIAEEDALAGVQPLHRRDPTPFGEPLPDDTSLEMEAAESRFEPLPREEIDAASSHLSPGEPGAEALRDEMSDWATPAPAHAPENSSGTADDVFDLSEAETLVEESELDVTWTERAEREAVPPSAPPPPRSSDDDEFGWFEDEFAAPAAEPTAPAAEARELDVPAPRMEATHREESDAQPASVDEPPAPVASSDSPASVERAHEEPDRTPAAFVTETMAELYLKQGFRNEALEVYRKLAVQSPGDQVIQARLAELEAGYGAAPDAAAPSEEARQPKVSLDRPAAAFFRSLASVPVPTPPSVPASIAQRTEAEAAVEAAQAAPDAAGPVEEAGRTAGSAWAHETLARFGEVREEDEAAARALVRGFAPEPPRSAAPRSATRAAAQEMSLHDIFGRSERAERPGTPGAMEAFFTPEGERANTESDEEGREDLEAFNAWLEGLKK